MGEEPPILLACPMACQEHIALDVKDKNSVSGVVVGVSLGYSSRFNNEPQKKNNGGASFLIFAPGREEKSPGFFRFYDFFFESQKQ